MIANCQAGWQTMIMAATHPDVSGPLLLAEVEGTVEAAIGLEDGETVANPFSENAGAVSLLQVRAAQLRVA